MTTDTPDTFASNDMMQLVGYGMTQAAAKQVFEAAGIGPEDVDVVELHDCFAHNELISYEALGLCPEGGAEKFVADGDNTYGGRFVTNPSGGLLSKGHPLGATGSRAVLRADAAAARNGGPAAGRRRADRPAAQSRTGRRLRRHAVSRQLMSPHAHCAHGSTTTLWSGARFPPHSADVEAGRLRLFAKATGETRPEYCDEAAARAAGHPSLPAPPTFRRLPLHGRARSVRRGFASSASTSRYVLHGAQAFRYFASVYAGDRLTFASRIEDVFRKKARRADVHHQGDRRHQPGGPARGRGPLDHRRRAANAEGARRLQRERGAPMSLSYDAINVGDELPPLALPPLTRTTLALYAGASGDHNPMHIDIDFARAAGMPDVFAHGMLSMAWLGRLLTEWVPQRDLREFSVRFTAMTHVGERIVCTRPRRARSSSATASGSSASASRRRTRRARSSSPARRWSSRPRPDGPSGDDSRDHAVSAPARAARPRLHHAQEPRADGVDAYGPRGGARRLRADGGVLRGACPRRRRAHRHRRHRAQFRRPRRAARVAAVVPVAGGQAPRSSPTPCTRPAARSRCRSCTRGATRITRCRSRLRPSARRSRRSSRAR